MLEARVNSFIDSDGGSEPFERLALDVFAYQHDRVPAYANLCERRGVDRDSVTTWRDIPAMPADAFKYDLGLTDERPHVFASSGTTAGAELRSRHALTTLETYRRSALAHFRAMVLPDNPGPMAVLLLGPSAESHAESSLGRMFSWCIDAFGSEKSAVAFGSDGNVDLEVAVDWLRRRAEGCEPVLLLAVTSAISALFDELRDRRLALRLPADSRLVDTGGKKSGAGDTRALSARGVLKAAWRSLHVPSYCCVNEYGMTEMLSQFYDDALLSRVDGRFVPRSKLGPAWVRTTIVDPVTLEPVAGSGTGILRHLDLAGWDSVACLQTLDLGRAHGRGFELLGRAVGAEARGCSQLLAEIGARDGATRSGP